MIGPLLFPLSRFAHGIKKQRQNTFDAAKVGGKNITTKKQKKCPKKISFLSDKWEKMASLIDLLCH